MPTCSLEQILRATTALRPGSSLDQNYAPQQLALGILAAQRAYPNLPLKTVFIPQDLRPGWIEAGQMVTNLARARSDTPLHEAGHVGLAVLAATDPQAYERVLREVDGTGAHQDVARRYPVTADYDYTDQLNEAATTLLGRVKARRLSGSTEQSVARRFVAGLRDGLARLTGLDFGALDEGHFLSLRLNRTLHQLGQDFLTGAARADLSAEHLKALLPGVYDQRDGEDRVQLPGTVSELLSTLTGQPKGMSARALERTTSDLLRRYPSQTFEYFAADGSLLSGSYESDDTGQRERQLKTLLLQQTTSAEAALMEQAIRLYDGNGLDAVEGEDHAKAQSRFRLAVQKLFPDVKDGDKVVRYSAEDTPDIYDPSLDTGNLLVRVGSRLVEGRPTAVYDIAAVTTEGLTLSSKDKHLLYGVAGGGLIGAAKAALAQVGIRSKLTDANIHRQSLAVTLLAMHVRQSGAGLTDNLAVGKLSLRKNKDDQNHVRLIYPTAELDFLRQLPTLGLTKDHLGGLSPALQQVLGNAELFTPALYQRDYLRFLHEYYRTAGRRDEVAVREALGEYEADKQGASVKKINQAIQARLSYLKHTLGDEADFGTNEEVVLLGRAQMRLAGVNELLNPHVEVGKIERYLRPFNSGTNAYSQWLYERIFTQRRQITQRYLDHQQAYGAVLDAYRAEYEAANPGSALTTRAGAIEDRYFRPLLVKNQYEAYDSTAEKGKEYSMVEVNEFRLHEPGSEAYKKLGPAAQALIDFQLDAVKSLLTERYSRQNPTKSASEVTDWYERNWSHGKLPIARGSAASHILAGSYWEATTEKVEQWMSETSAYDRTDNPDRDTINDLFSAQGGSGPLGSATRLRLLGLQEDMTNTSGTPRYIIDSDGGLARAKSNEGDLRRAHSLFVMNQLKLGVDEDLNVSFHTALALLNVREDETSVLRGKGGDKGRRGEERVSRDEQDLKAMYAMLWRQQRSQGDHSSGTKRAAAIAGLMAKMTTYGVLAFNVKTAKVSLIANATAIVTQSLANWGGANGFSADNLGFGMKALATDGRKVYALARQLGILKMDEFDLLNDHVYNNERLQASDATDMGFLPDQLGDASLRLFLLAAQMDKHKTWDAYTYHPETKRVSYNESKDPRPQPVRNAIREQLVATGDLEPNQALDRAYDDALLRTLESYATDALGGYKDEVRTVLATTVLGKALGQFKTYMIGRINRLTQEGHFNPNRVSYDTESGEQISEFEEGILRTFCSFIARGAAEGGRPDIAWRELNPGQQRNLKGLAINTAGCLLLGLITGAFEDDKEMKRDGRARRAQTTLQVMAQEMSVMASLQGGASALDSPLVSVDYLKRIGASLADIYHGEFSKAGQKAYKQLGVSRTFQLLSDAD